MKELKYDWPLSVVEVQRAKKQAGPWVTGEHTVVDVVVDKRPAAVVDSS